MYRQNRNTTFWINQDTGIGPGNYNATMLTSKETFNTGYVSFVNKCLLYLDQYLLEYEKTDSNQTSNFHFNHYLVKIPLFIL